MTGGGDPAAPRSPSPWAVGWRGFRANLGPGLVLQGAAGAVVAAYYLWPAAAAGLSAYAAWRQSLGLPGAALTTGLFGGLIPFLYLRATGPHGDRPTWLQGGFLSVFWALRGMDVDLLYRAQTALFGAEVTPATIALKVAVDQFVICLLYAVPVTAAAYAWMHDGFRARAWRDVLRPGWYQRVVLPAYLTNLGVWVPACALIYSLPPPLQLPLFNLVLCFFALIFAHVARATRAAGLTSPADVPGRSGRPDAAAAGPLR